MKSKQVFFGMIGLVVIMIGLVFATIFVGDKYLQNQSQKLISLKLDDKVMETQETSLIQAKKDIQKYSQLEALARQIVPQDKDQAKATREIITLAEQSGIKIASIGFPPSNLGQTAPKATPATPTTNQPATTPAIATPSVSQVKPVEGISGLYKLDIVVSSEPTRPSSYAKLIDFLNRLEQNRRTAQVSQISIQPDPNDRTVLNFSLTITLYLKP